MARRRVRSRPQPQDDRRRALTELAATAAVNPGDRQAALAELGDYPYPGRRSNGDPWIGQLQDAAVKFWGSRGVDANGVRVVIADDLLEPGAVGLGRKDAREVVLDGRVAGGYLANARNVKNSVRGRRRNLFRLGELIAHEVGHVGGLEHSEDGGLMSAHSALGETNPAELQALIRELIPRNATPNARERAIARKRRAAARRGTRIAEG